MTRMTSRPRIGALLREGMRRKSLKQHELAELVHELSGQPGPSRSAVNAWLNDRSWPQDYYIVPLEQALGVEIPRIEGAGDNAGPPSREELHRSLDRMNDAELAELAKAWNAFKAANSSDPRQERAG